MTESNESFQEMFSEYEKSRSRQPGGNKELEGTVISVSGEAVLVDIGFKTDGILPLAACHSPGGTVNPGDKLLVTITGRDPDGYYELSRGNVQRPKDWSSLEKAFADKVVIVGTATGVVNGGLSVDVGVRAFLPASRSGARDATEMEKLVGQEIRCRIIKLDVADEDVVVDRRTVVEEEDRARKEHRYSEIRVGETVRGEVRSLTDYGAFVDVGGVDALLHVSDIVWGRVNRPEDVLSLGQLIEAKVLKVDPHKRRISLGMKQLQPSPWDLAAEKYQVGGRVCGAVTRVADFGAFVELEPGIEGLIHISEISWSKRVRSPSDVVQPGETVEAVILGVNVADHRISLGLKQALGDPWAEISQRFAVGSVIEGPVTSITTFGAFVHLSEGVEGMVHIGNISADQRLHHPQDVLKVGQLIRAQVLEVDKKRRRISLGMKQLLPTSLDEYLAEHKEGDVVTGRMIQVSGGRAGVELGEGIQGTCRLAEEESSGQDAPAQSKTDLSSLSSMLEARWKCGVVSGPKPEAVSAGQIRSFRIVKLDPASKMLELELA